MIHFEEGLTLETSVFEFFTLLTLSLIIYFSEEQIIEGKQAREYRYNVNLQFTVGNHCFFHWNR